MKSVRVVVRLVLRVGACSKKEEETEVIPPGFCKTEAECQPMADRQNAYQEELRQKLLAQGVHEQYLPCGKYKTTKAPNSYWNVIRDTTECPYPASQQDPHPNLGKATTSPKSQAPPTKHPPTNIPPILPHTPLPLLPPHAKHHT